VSDAAGVSGLGALIACVMSRPAPQKDVASRSCCALIIPLGLLVLVFVLIEVFGVIPD